MLRECFISAWKELEKVYYSGAICSERHMQAELFHILMNNENFNSLFKIKIEPSLYGEGLDEFQLKGIIPDLLIIKDKEIVAHVEIKYMPHAFVLSQKDITNMVKLWRAKGSKKTKLYLDANPKNGDWDYEKTYTISDDFILIYAFIANHESIAITDKEFIWSNSYTSLTEKPNYLQLIGSVHPEIITFEHYS